MCIIVLRGEKELRLRGPIVRDDGDGNGVASGHTVLMCNGWIVGQLPTSYHIIRIALDFPRS